MSFSPRLLKKQSSLAILVEQERAQCESPSRPPSEIDEEQEEETSEVVELPAQEELQDDVESQNREGESDAEGGDTDVPLSSEDEGEAAAVSTSQWKQKSGVSVLDSVVVDEVAPPIRMSRRLMSMKRRGKIRPLADLTEEFEFYADDVLTVRGDEGDFYVCRVLEDVPESATSFRVAWFNRVEENVYEVR